MKNTVIAVAISLLSALIAAFVASNKTEERVMAEVAAAYSEGHHFAGQSWNENMKTVEYAPDYIIMLCDRKYARSPDNTQYEAFLVNLRNDACYGVAKTIQVDQSWASKNRT
jgi:hypothetical protein